MKYLTVLAILLLSILVLGCTGTEEPNNVPKTFTFNFHVQETNEPLNGKVYLHNELLGEAQNGTLAVPKEAVFPGTVNLNGTYNGSTFGFSFELNKVDIENYTSTNYVVSDKNLKQVVYNWSNVDMSSTPRQVFDKINVKRAGQGLSQLKWNDKFASVAEIHAKELAEKGVGYKHDVADIYIENGIFSRSSGYLLFDTTGTSPETDVASTVIDNWYSTSSLKSMMLTDYFDTAGAAVYCKEKGCFIVIDLGTTEYSETFELKHDYCTSRQIYWQDFSFSSVNVKITVSSPKSIDVYVLASENDYKPCTPHRYIEAKKDVTSFETQLNANKSNVLMFNALVGSNISYKIEYIN